MTFCVPVMPPSYVSLPPSPLAFGWSLVLLPSTAATWNCSRASRGQQRQTTSPTTGASTHDAHAALEGLVVGARDEEVAALVDLDAGQRLEVPGERVSRGRCGEEGRGALDRIFAAPASGVAEARADLVAVVHELADHVPAGVAGYALRRGAHQGQNTGARARSAAAGSLLLMAEEESRSGASGCCSELCACVRGGGGGRGGTP